MITKKSKRASTKKNTKTSAKAARGRLTPMHVSRGFRAFVLEQMHDVPGVRDRAMFGGVGIYAGDLFFAILASDVLYFKVNDTNRAEYESAGATPFKPYGDRAMTMPYYAVPASVLEDSATLAAWATRAIAVATATRKDKTSRARRTRKA